MRDPRRRNRNIGTAKSGHGADNRLTIPERWWDLSRYWETLSSYVPVSKTIWNHAVAFLVEPPRSGFAHHCTVQDVLRVLELLPREHTAHIELVVFRQPTTKQSILKPMWGRLGYWSKIGDYQGPGIYLEAQPPELTMKWGKSLGPDDRAELERLEMVGFRVVPHRRGYDVHSTPGAIRASQLYRTLPHEVGHYVDYLECRERYDWGDDEERFWELYDAKPSREKEVYAHRYADEFLTDMEATGLLPFAPDGDAAQIRRTGSCRNGLRTTYQVKREILRGEETRRRSE